VGSNITRQKAQGGLRKKKEPTAQPKTTKRQEISAKYHLFSETQTAQIMKGKKES
jgi:hypothetical protein